MKKSLLFASLLSLTVAFSSCGGKEESKDEKKEEKKEDAKEADESDEAATGWIDAFQKTYMDNCVGTAKAAMTEELATTYCACTLEKLMAAYPNPADVASLPGEEIQALAAQCMTEEMMPTK